MSPTWASTRSGSRPSSRSPMRDFGYDVSDYRAVEPVFGSNADFDRLVAEAHRRGLKVIIDMVLAHCSDEHAWFQESRQSRDNPKADWFVWADAKPDGSPPNNWQSVFGGPSWQWDSRRSQYFPAPFPEEPAEPELAQSGGGRRHAGRGRVLAWNAASTGCGLDAITTLVHDARNCATTPPSARTDRSISAVATRARSPTSDTSTTATGRKSWSASGRLRALTDRYPGPLHAGRDRRCRQHRGDRALHQGHPRHCTAAIPSS